MEDSKTMLDQFVCLSGLPRTGSTLLSAILSQNPRIHAEGNSAVCQLMWDVQQSCQTTSRQQLHAASDHPARRINNIMQSIPQAYYADRAPEQTIVVDKCRSWTIPANQDLLRQYVRPDYKIIIMERSVTDIVRSFGALYRRNHVANIDDALLALLKPNSEPIMRSLAGINLARKHANKREHFHFVQYDDLVQNPAQVVQDIYTFCGWQPYFAHDFDAVICKYPENDAVYQLAGQHDIRASVAKQHNDFVLPSMVAEKCAQIDRLRNL